MGAFSGEEKLDLLFKKVAGGVTKTGRSDDTGLDGESISSFTAVAPTHLWREATSTNITAAAPASNTAYIGVYEVGGSGSVGTTGQVVAPVTCSSVGSAAHMPGFTNFKRSWDTGLENWIGPAFGSNYKVRVYVGASGWDGTEGGKTTSSIVEVEFGQNPNADWNFDYEAGILYWTNEEDSGETSSFEDSTDFVNTGSVIANGDIVYVTGYRYIGATGVGGGIELTDFSVTQALASGDGTLVYDNAGEFTYTPPDLSGYLESETSHADVLVDGDFTSQGIMLRGASAGSYSILTDNSSNWNTAHGWGNHASAGYLTSETSHADVVVDGDFSSQGIMLRGASAGQYSITADNTTNWDTAYGWGDHSAGGYLTSETSHADVVVDGDFASQGIMLRGASAGNYSILANNSANWNTAHGWGNHASVGYLESETDPVFSAHTTSNISNGTGFLKNNGSGTWSYDSSVYLTSETSHADVLVDGDFSTAGIMATNGSGSYSIVTNNSSNWDTAFGWGNHASAGYLSAETFTSVAVAEGAAAAHKVVLTTANAGGTITGVQIDTADLTYTPSADTDRGKLTTGDLLVKGDLTVLGEGTVINLQQENVYMKDAIITLGNQDDGADDDYTDAAELAVNIGIEAFKKGYVTNDAAKYPKVVFDHSASVWAVNNWSHAASAENKIAEKFVSAAYSWTSTDETNGYAEITHNLNTQRILVQVTNASDEIVYVKFIANGVQTARIYIAAAAENDVFDIVIIG